MNVLSTSLRLNSSDITAANRWLNREYQRVEERRRQLDRYRETITAATGDAQRREAVQYA